MRPVMVYMVLSALGGCATALLCPSGKFGYDCESTCHCKRNTQCDVTSGTCPSGCAARWSGRTCQRENIAYRQKTEQKDGAHAQDASLAVDNDVVTCSSTKRGEPGWWSVTLSYVRRIERMKLLTNTTGSIHGWHVYAGMEEKMHSMTLCSTVRMRGPGATITCDTPILGDHVMIVSRVGTVVLCDAQVYVCSQYWYGKECDKRCNCADTAEVCDTYSGACATGCAPGYTGSGCESVCDGYYGPDCMYKCGYCVDDTQCDHVTGFCLRGCEAGWSGPRCRDACSNATFGPDCAHRCGHCRGHVACEQTNGACPVGCQAGWHGDRCMSVCESGTYGENCRFTCGRCDSNRPCDPQTGACAHNCADGYEGVFCTQKCPDGFHGKSCAEQCGACRPSSTCDKKTGSCPDGCADGYSGETCTGRSGGEPDTEAAQGDTFSDEDGPQLKLFLGTTLSIVFGLMAAVICCLVLIWHREPLLEKEKTEVTSDELEIFYHRKGSGRSRDEDDVTDYV